MKHLGLFVFSLLLLASCSKDIRLEPAEVLDRKSTYIEVFNGIQVVNGTLKFTDSLHIQAVFNELEKGYKENANANYNNAKAMTDAELAIAQKDSTSFSADKNLIDFENKFVGFTSFRYFIKKADADYLKNTENADPENMPSHKLLLPTSTIMALLDKNGEVLIGEQRVNVLETIVPVQQKALSCFRAQATNTIVPPGGHFMAKVTGGVIRVGWPLNLTQAFSKTQTYRRVNGWFWSYLELMPNWLLSDWYGQLNTSTCTYFTNKQNTYDIGLQIQVTHSREYEYADTYWWRWYHGQRGKWNALGMWSTNRNFNPYGISVVRL